MDDLRFIRRTMERAGSFTAVPGWGGVGIGVAGTLGAVVAAQQETAEGWLAAWLVTAAVAILVGSGTMGWKAHRAGVSLVTGPGRKFLLSFLPSVVVGMALTVALYLQAAASLLPGLWLLCYGASVVAAGTQSVRAVPLMGVAFLALGCAALATPAAWADVWLGLGFGGLHVGFGILIARRHGG
jgi:hypothetical protein